MIKKKKPKKSTKVVQASNNQTRIPRPLGLTLSLKSHPKQENEPINDQSLQIILSNYIANNYQLLKRTISIPQLSKYLDIDNMKLTRQLFIYQTKMYNLGEEQLGEQGIKDLVGGLFSWILEDRLRISHQASILMASQGNEYKPFISSEVNRSLELMLKSQSGMAQLIGLFKDSQKGLQVNIQNNIQANQQGTEVFTVMDAMKLIQGTHDLSSEQGNGPNGNKALLGPQADSISYLDQKYQTDSFMDLHSNTVDREYGNFDEDLLKARTEEQGTEKVDHDNRREVQLGISDEDDSI